VIEANLYTRRLSGKEGGVGKEVSLIWMMLCND
jgi:hypothetical protein